MMGGDNGLQLIQDQRAAKVKDVDNVRLWDKHQSDCAHSTELINRAMPSDHLYFFDKDSHVQVHRVRRTRKYAHTQSKAKTCKACQTCPQKCQSQRINFLISGGRKQTGAAENKAKLHKRTVWELMSIIITTSRCVASPREVWPQFSLYLMH